MSDISRHTVPCRFYVSFLIHEKFFIMWEYLSFLLKINFLFKYMLLGKFSLRIQCSHFLLLILLQVPKTMIKQKKRKHWSKCYKTMHFLRELTGTGVWVYPQNHEQIISKQLVDDYISSRRVMASWSFLVLPLNPLRFCVDQFCSN